MPTKKIVIEAKTIKEAIEKALTQLQAKAHEVEIKILREEHNGLFGMEGAESAKIQASLKKRPKK
ncbi:MAG: Jag N-terminal domain-containing protein [Candidatus Omnitrophica bacterium]|nr:Jag N-terminal domain-containing protein [Candidatus Omnitrophota bacterium]